MIFIYLPSNIASMVVVIIAGGHKKWKWVPSVSGEVSWRNLSVHATSGTIQSSPNQVADHVRAAPRIQTNTATPTTHNHATTTHTIQQQNRGNTNQLNDLIIQTQFSLIEHTPFITSYSLYQQWNSHSPPLPHWPLLSPSPPPRHSHPPHLSFEQMPPLTKFHSQTQMPHSSCPTTTIGQPPNPPWSAEQA